MKMLKEVIKAFECCENGEFDSNCEKCPYDGIGSCCLERQNDALEYLKAYCNDKNDLTALRAYWKEQHENPPLTWDELICMNDKPVWVEVDGKWWGKFWAFAEAGNDSYINFFQKGQEYPEDLWKSGMGKTWNAFRKERK